MSCSESHLGHFRPKVAWVLLAVLLLLSAYGTLGGLQPKQAVRPAIVDRDGGDLALYRTVAHRVEAGESYYEVVVSEHRARGYPLRPAFAVRLPTLTLVLSLLQEQRAFILLQILAGASIAALAFRLKGALKSRLLWGAAVAIAAAAAALITGSAMVWWHEAWAAFMIVLSLACRTERCWGLSVAFGLAAVLLRELALPYLFLMTILAWHDRSRAEAAAWAGAIAVFIGAMTSHVAMLDALVTSTDRASPGWAGGGGWTFVVTMAQEFTLFAMAPLPTVPLLLPLALCGWLGLQTSFSRRVALLLFGYVAGFMIFGRPDNLYWIILIAPLLPVGLAFAPIALRALIGAALGRRWSAAPL